MLHVWPKMPTQMPEIHMGKVTKKHNAGIKYTTSYTDTEQQQQQQQLFRSARCPMR